MRLSRIITEIVLECRIVAFNFTPRSHSAISVGSTHVSIARIYISDLWSTRNTLVVDRVVRVSLMRHSRGDSNEERSLRDPVWNIIPKYPVSSFANIRERVVCEKPSGAIFLGLFSSSLPLSPAASVAVDFEQSMIDPEFRRKLIVGVLSFSR